MSRIGAAYVDIVVIPKKYKPHRKDAKDAKRNKSKPRGSKNSRTGFLVRSILFFYPAIGFCPDSLRVLCVFAVKS